MRSSHAEIAAARRPRWLLAALASMLTLIAGVVLTREAQADRQRQGDASPSPAAAQTGPSARRGASGSPNIVLIQTDDQSFHQLSAMPRAQRTLRRQGVSFRRHFVSSPTCCPSRATLLTGQYPHNHGVTGGCGGGGRGTLPFDEDDGNALPVWLDDAGYRTAHVGKYLNGYGSLANDPNGENRIPPGWDRWYTGVGASTGDVYRYSLNENGRLVDYRNRIEDFKQDVFTRHATRLVRRFAQPRRSGGSPLYLQLDYTAPHGAGKRRWPQPPERCRGYAMPAPRHAKEFRREPLRMDPSFNEDDVSDKPDFLQRDLLTQREIRDIRQRENCRLGSLQSVDEGIGQLVAALREERALSNTYVIFTSDNGFFAGEHRLTSGKGLAYDPAARVPMLIRGPGLERGGTSEPTSNTDTTATIVDAAGAAPGRSLDGRSLLDGGLADRDVLIESPSYSAVRSREYLWIEHSREGEPRELYDLARDPFLLESRHDDPDYAQVRAERSARLAQLRGCSGASCR